MPCPPAPFVRFSRDNRGYEHIYLVHAGVGRGVPRARVLYWYRTPPDVKVGRQPFDDQVQKALEAQYPELRFDWKRIVEAQAPPPPEVEHWRERRRAERSVKQARTALSPERAASAEPAPEESEISSTLVLAESSPPVTVASFLEPEAEPESAAAGGPAESDERDELADDQGAAGTEAAAADVPTTHVAVRGRRRRGGRRGRRGTRGGAMQPSGIATQVDWPAGEAPAPAGPQAEAEGAEAAQALAEGENDETAGSDSTS